MNRGRTPFSMQELFVLAESDQWGVGDKCLLWKKWWDVVVRPLVSEDECSPRAVPLVETDGEMPPAIIYE